MSHFKPGNDDSLYPQRCLGDGELRELATTSAVPEPVRVHLDSCSRCRSELKRYTHILDALARSDTESALAEAVASDSAGLPETLLRYKVLTRLGAGGQAEVYLGFDESLKRRVVIKLGQVRLEHVEEAIEYCRREGRVLAELGEQVSAVPQVYEFDLVDGRPALVIEHILGQDLGEYCGGRELSVDRIAEIAAELAEALDEVHRRNVSHLDVKPENVMVDEDGRVRLVDFGLARIKAPWGDFDFGSGRISGTVRYMAPEQASGDTARLGPSTDVFLLGATLFTLLTGRTPYSSPSYEECLEKARACEFDAGALTEANVPVALRRICLRAMRKNREDRYGTAGRMAADLRRFLRRRVIWVSGAASIGVAAVVFLGIRLAFPEGDDPSSNLEVKIHRRGLGMNLESAVPVAQGEGIRVRFEVSGGTESASLLLFEPPAELREFPLRAESPGARSGRVVYVFPDSVNFKPLDVSTTAILIVCAGARTDRSLELLRSFLKARPPAESWDLEPPFTIHFDRERHRVIERTADGDARERGFGEGIIEGSGIEHLVDDLREELKGEYEVFRGIAFRAVP